MATLTRDGFMAKGKHRRVLFHNFFMRLRNGMVKLGHLKKYNVAFQFKTHRALLRKYQSKVSVSDFAETLFILCQKRY